jgi:hypothetical protein
LDIEAEILSLKQAENQRLYRLAALASPPHDFSQEAEREALIAAQLPAIGLSPENTA